MSKKKVKLSPWHDGRVKPVNVGLYKRDWTPRGCDISWSYWNGNYWGLSFKINSHLSYEESYEKAFIYKDERGGFQDSLPWQGTVK